MDLSGTVAPITNASGRTARGLPRQPAEHGAWVANRFKGNEEAARRGGSFRAVPRLRGMGFVTGRFLQGVSVGS